MIRLLFLGDLPRAFDFGADLFVALLDFFGAVMVVAMVGSFRESLKSQERTCAADSNKCILINGD